MSETDYRKVTKSLSIFTRASNKKKYHFNSIFINESSINNSEEKFRIETKKQQKQQSILNFQSNSAMINDSHSDFIKQRRKTLRKTFYHHTKEMLRQANNWCAAMSPKKEDKIVYKNFSGFNSIRVKTCRIKSKQLTKKQELKQLQYEKLKDQLKNTVILKEKKIRNYNNIECNHFNSTISSLKKLEMNLSTQHNKYFNQQLNPWQINQFALQ